MMPKRVISQDVTPSLRGGACIVRKIKCKNNIITEIKAIAICQTNSGDRFFIVPQLGEDSNIVVLINF